MRDNKPPGGIPFLSWDDDSGCSPLSYSTFANLSSSA
jgi:hypothetical protein